MSEIANKLRNLRGDPPCEVCEWLNGYCQGSKACNTWPTLLADKIDEEIKALDPRLMPEGLVWPKDKDGKQIKIGGTYFDEDGEIWAVTAVRPGYIYDIFASSLQSNNTNKTLKSYCLTIEMPDTQERIDEDKRKGVVQYWDCRDIHCEDCKIFKDTSPSTYYNVFDCSVAQGMDLARRQSELDALLGDIS